jgi:hypothetical protein
MWFDVGCRSLRQAKPKEKKLGAGDEPDPSFL